MSLARFRPKDGVDCYAIGAKVTVHVLPVAPEGKIYKMDDSLLYPIARKRRTDRI